MNTSGHTEHDLYSVELPDKQSARLAYTVADAVAASGIGRTTLYGLMGSGKLPFVKLGNRTLIRRIDLEALLDRHIAAPSGDCMDKRKPAA